MLDSDHKNRSRLMLNHRYSYSHRCNIPIHRIRKHCRCHYCSISGSYERSRIRETSSRSRTRTSKTGSNCHYCYRCCCCHRCFSSSRKCRLMPRRRCSGICRGRTRSRNHYCYSHLEEYTCYIIRFKIF